MSDLERSVEFYEKALGMKLHHRSDESGQQGAGFRSAILGFADQEPRNQTKERTAITCQEVVLEVTERNDFAGCCVGCAPFPCWGRWGQSVACPVGQEDPLQMGWEIPMAGNPA